MAVAESRRSGTGSAGAPAMTPPEGVHVSDELRVSEVPGDVRSVVDRLTAGLRDRGVEVFATIDHAAGARAAGLELPD